jgi:hypothetical protein
MPQANRHLGREQQTNKIVPMLYPRKMTTDYSDQQQACAHRRADLPSSAHLLTDARKHRQRPLMTRQVVGSSPTRPTKSQVRGFTTSPIHDRTTRKRRGNVSGGRRDGQCDHH